MFSTNLMWWFLLIPLAYVVLLLIVARASVYPVRIPLFLSPGAMGARQHDVTLHGADGATLASWWVPPGGDELPNTVVILAHGYMMNRSEPSPLAALLAKEGYGCFLFDFRAHGRSSGRRSGLGWSEREDVIAAMNWVKRTYPNSAIVLWGSSMGAAACAFAAAQWPESVKALVLDSAYSQLSHAVGGWWSFVGGRALRVVLAPAALTSRLFLGFSLNSVDVSDALSKLNGTPVLLMHGRSDSLATPDQAERNLQAAGPNARIEWFDSCAHSEARWVQPERYQRELLAFLAELPAES